MAAHRYWRIYITESVSASNLDIREVEFRTSISGADVTGSGTASASSEAGGFEASKAFDNSSGTTWYTSSATRPQWLAYDFGSGNDQDIVEVQITSWSEAEHIRSWQFQHSDDGSAWTTLWTIEYDKSLPTNTSRTYSATDTPTMNGAYTFWRIRATTVDGGTAFGVMEMEWRDGGGTDQASGGKAFASSNDNSANWPELAYNDAPTTTPWASFGAPPAWNGYRWSGSTDIRAIAVTARTDGFHSQSPKDFVIEYWDGSAYQTAYTPSSQTGWTSGETRVFSWGSVVPATGGRASDFFAFL
jgi:hypothetical protein